MTATTTTRRACSSSGRRRAGARPEQITDPNYAATAFYTALKDVNGWDSMPLTEAAQTVQVSAYPDHYAKWEKLAGDIIKGVEGEGPFAGAAAAAGIR